MLAQLANAMQCITTLNPQLIISEFQCDFFHSSTK